MTQQPEGVSSSNRKETCPVFGHRLFGVDKVSVSFPVENVMADGDWGTRTISGPADAPIIRRSDSVEIAPGVRAMVGVSDIPAIGRQFAKVECNPSRLIDPDGWTASAGTSATRDAVARAIVQAHREGFFTPMVDHAGAVKLKRLDLARDFGGVTSPTQILGGLIGVHRNHSRQARVFYDPDKNGAQTLTVGGKRNQARAYDKEQESGPEAAGFLRAEFLCRDWLTRYSDMAHLDDMTDDKLDELGRDRFDWSGMGTTVASSVQGVIDAVARLDLSPTKERHLLGYLLQSGYGLPTQMSRTTAAEYRRLAKQAGVAMALDGLGQDEAEIGFTARLDLESGTEVLSV